MTIDSSSNIPPPDSIRIAGLRLSTHIGVPAEERETPQSVEAHILMLPLQAGLAGLEDEIEKTVNYYDVAQCLRQLAMKGERHLIESLAEECVDALLSKFPVRSVTVEIRKFILADTNYVAVTLSKTVAE